MKTNRIGELATELASTLVDHNINLSSLAVAQTTIVNNERVITDLRAKLAAAPAAAPAFDGDVAAMRNEIATSKATAAVWQQQAAAARADARKDMIAARKHITQLQRHIWELEYNAKAQVNAVSGKRGRSHSPGQDEGTAKKSKLDSTAVTATSTTIKTATSTTTSTAIKTATATATTTLTATAAAIGTARVALDAVGGVYTEVSSAEEALYI